jgi:two-component system, NarL family, nitrate/nitrite response regulator NarL
MISVVVADDHALIRVGIEAVLSGSRFRIVAAVGDGAEALAAIECHDPAIAVLDADMPGMSGVEALQALRANRDLRTVVMLADRITDRQLLAVMSAGVQGIVSKSSDAPELLATLERASRGQNAISPALRQRARDLSQHPDAPGPLQRLSLREQSIARLVAQGLKNRDIGAQLGIGEGTVKVYLHTIYQKLGIANRTALAMLAVAHIGQKPL